MRRGRHAGVLPRPTKQAKDLVPGRQREKRITAQLTTSTVGFVDSIDVLDQGSVSNSRITASEQLTKRVGVMSMLRINRTPRRCLRDRPQFVLKNVLEGQHPD